MRRGHGKTWGTAEPSLIPAAGHLNLDIRFAAFCIAACAGSPGHSRARALAIHFNITRNKLASASTASRACWPSRRPAQALLGYFHERERRLGLDGTITATYRRPILRPDRRQSKPLLTVIGRNGSERGDKAKVWRLSCQCCRLRPHNGVALEQAAV